MVSVYRTLLLVLQLDLNQVTPKQLNLLKLQETGELQSFLSLKFTFTLSLKRKIKQNCKSLTKSKPMTFYISWMDAVTAELQGISQKGSSRLLEVRVTHVLHTAQIGNVWKHTVYFGGFGFL